MRKPLSILAFVVVLVALFAPAAYATAAPTQTTLSAAISNTYTTTAAVASATNIGVGTLLYVDRELMSVTSVSGTTLKVVRGSSGTRAAQHASGAVVTFGAVGYINTTDKAGACTATSEPILPVVNVANGKQFNCLGSMWVQTGQGDGIERVCYAKYNFSTDGGAQGTITPAINCTIPDNAIITNVFVNSTTAVTSSGSATVAVGTSAGSSTTALLGATAIASLGADAKVVGVPVPQTAATWVKLSAAGKITVTVATADLSAGVVEVFAKYLVASN